MLPDPSDFARYPASWYPFCSSRELQNKPLSKMILGRRLVAFRDCNRIASILDGSCSHLCADLGLGEVKESTIQCPYHGWRYAADGQCVEVPGMESPPSFAKQQKYPTIERNGWIFFFNAEEASFPLPFFEGENYEHFVTGKPFYSSFDSPWYMVIANGFDSQHFDCVHDRKLLKPAKIDSPDSFSHRIQYHAEITGRSAYDFILKKSVQRTVIVSITSYGPFLLVSADFGKLSSYMIISSQPIEHNNTQLEVIVFAPRSNSLIKRVLFQRIGLWLRRLFTKGFLEDDVSRLRGVRYNPSGLVAVDKGLINYFNWVAKVPEGIKPKA